MDQSLDINLTKELEFKISLPHSYKNTLGLFQKHGLMLVKRLYKNIIESIDGDTVACEIQNAIYRQLRKLLETTFSEMNLMIDYCYKGN